MILAKTIKGYGLGEAGEGKNITHQQKKLNDGGAARVPRALRHPDLRRGGRPGAVLPARRRQPGDALPARAPHEARRLPAQRAAPSRRRSRRRTTRSSPSSSRARTSARPRPRWCSCACWPSCCATKALGPPDRADRARRGPHVRHGGAVPPGRHLLPRRAALRAGRPRDAAVLQGSDGRADPRGGHHRGRLDVLVHRRGHGLRHARRAHDPVLHLLFDVRLPAHRRPGLGRGRHAAAAGSWSAAQRGARRSPARGCSTRTGTATFWPTPTRTSWPTTRPSPTRSR